MDNGISTELYSKSELKYPYPEKMCWQIKARIDWQRNNWISKQLKSK